MLAQLLFVLLINMKSSSCSLTEIQQRIDEVTRFLSITLNIANAHTVEFYTHDVWKRFVAVSPEDVLSAVGSGNHQQREPQHRQSGKLVPTKQESEGLFFSFLLLSNMEACFLEKCQRDLIS